MVYGFCLGLRVSAYPTASGFEFRFRIQVLSSYAYKDHHTPVIRGGDLRFGDLGVGL